MTVLKTIGDGYYIASEKEDYCQSNWHEGYYLFGGLLASFIFCALIYLIVFGSGAALLCVILGVITELILIMASLDRGCGVRIVLFHYSKITILVHYRFSGDAGQDAKQIQKIVERYKQYVGRLIVVQDQRRKDEQVRQEQCCNQYTEAIQKVKGG